LSIPANNRVLVTTGLAIAVPEGTHGRITLRSGQATKLIILHAGVIDADYRGGLKVLLINDSKMDYEVQQGDRIAQMMIEKINDHK